MTQSNGRVRPVGLRPQRDHFDIGEVQARHRVAQEFGLLPGGFDQRVAPVRVRDGEWQARKPRAGADVRDREAAQVRQHRERVEQVLVHALGRFADRRQVHARVPVRKLVKERPERLDLRRREREAEPAQIPPTAVPQSPRPRQAILTTVRPWIWPFT